MCFSASRFGACVLLATLYSAFDVCAQGYRVERIASNLNQPTFVTQAPGDPANILYYIERTANPSAGFNVNSAMGRVFRYNTTTRTSTAILNLSYRTLTQDAGILAMAFNPDFNTPGTPGYQKFYLSTSQTGGPTAVNRVEEYTVDSTGFVSNNAPTRTILQYNNTPGSSNNHTVDWIGFDPTAAGSAKNYLYIDTGDGSFPLSSRPSQDLSDVKGKMLRVDINPSAADAYPSDPNKNFAIPSGNPLVAGGLVNASRLGEIYVSGLRNPWRASFDRATGDLYVGDVGENSVEEVDFLKAGTNLTGLPKDFGWPQREGTSPGLTPGPSAGSLNPIQQFPHTGGGNSVTGGFVYRGPITTLQGKYIYADFVQEKVFALDFNRNTDPTTFNGAKGTVTDVTALFNSLVVDPSDPTYTAANAGGLFGLGHIVSFGEDNSGNLYLVDFGYGVGFNSQYPPAGQGEIFRLTPTPEPTILFTLLPVALLVRRRAKIQPARGRAGCRNRTDHSTFLAA